MKIVRTYSHLNGEEWLLQHKPELWSEIIASVEAVDAEACKTKISKEKTMKGKRLYSPTDLNKAFKKELHNMGWAREIRTDYYVCEDSDVTRETLHLSKKEQKAYIEARGLVPIPTHNTADYEKDSISIEVQFGKYSFVQFDLFIKHAANYMNYRIDLGVEIVPMKSMELEMSSGPPYFEKHLHEILRQGRIFPPVPILLVGIAP